MLIRSLSVNLTLQVWKSGRLDFGWLDCWVVEIRMIGLWTVEPFDYNLIQMDDYPADSCAISPRDFLFYNSREHEKSPDLLNILLFIIMARRFMRFHNNTYDYILV